MLRDRKKNKFDFRTSDFQPETLESVNRTVITADSPFLIPGSHPYRRNNCKEKYLQEGIVD